MRKLVTETNENGLECDSQLFFKDSKLVMLNGKSTTQP